ncbi:transposase, partial [uncultured Salegentibacter sp.]|uniref:transposase n=1 Tax=uncultured Salegentibacter sp. TaxID=259320 RepID=UPI0030DCACDA
YNLQASTNNQFITNYTLAQTTADTTTLKDHLQDHIERRCWDVEAVFGNIKQNMGFKRFMLRGMDKVTTEIGLIAMAHNLRKFSIA